MRLLERLERLRQEDPAEGLMAAKEAVQSASAEELPYVFAEWASCLRRLGELEGAISALATAKSLRKDDPMLRGELLQRMSFVYCDRGEYELALKFARDAAHFHLIAGNLKGIGRALVDQGGFLFHLERFRESARESEAALRYLPEEQESHRYSALINAAHVYQLLGETQRARRRSKQAAKILNIPTGLRVSAAWLAAEAALALGEASAAIGGFEAAVDYYLEKGELLNVALASAQLTQALYLAGRKNQAHLVAKGMTRLVEPLRKNPVASAAIVELIIWGMSSTSQTAFAELVERIRKAGTGRARFG